MSDAMGAVTLPQGLEPTLRELADLSATGWLVATNGRVQKRIAFDRGAAVFAASNDPRDLMGQALLRAGLISEKDLAQALAMPNTTGGSTPHLFAALIAMKKVTPEQTKAVFEQKLRESVLDLFLWQAGSVERTGGDMPPGAVFPTRIPIAVLLDEGPKRRTRWKAVKRELPSFDVAFERKTDWPAGFPETPGDKRLARLIESGQTLSKILLELHGQDYAIAIRVTSLLQKGVLATRAPAAFGEIEVEVPIDVVEPESAAPRQVSSIPTGEFTKVVADPGPAEEEPPPTFSNELTGALMERANELIAAEKYEEALAVLTELIQNDPFAAGEAWEQMNVVETAIVAQAEAAGLVKTATLALAKPVTTFSSTVFPPDQAFVLSRFAAGKMTVGELIALCPFPPVELYRILRKFLDEKIIKRV